MAVQMQQPGEYYDPQGRELPVLKQMNWACGQSICFLKFHYVNGKPE
jgi:hypothetical protein